MLTRPGGGAAPAAAAAGLPEERLAVLDYLLGIKRRAPISGIVGPGPALPRGREQRALAGAEAGADILIGTNLMFSAARNAQAFARLKDRCRSR